MMSEWTAPEFSLSEDASVDAWNVAIELSRDAKEPPALVTVSDLQFIDSWEKLRSHTHPRRSSWFLLHADVKRYTYVIVVRHVYARTQQVCLRNTRHGASFAHVHIARVDCLANIRKVRR